MAETEIVVIGAGIAGASAAAELAADATVVLLEMEAQPGYHSTGRSAAYFAAAYGKKVARDFTGCCEAFFNQPPDGFSDLPLLRPRDCMFFGRSDQAASLQAMHEDNPALTLLDADAVRRRVPVFAEDYLHGALWEQRGGDLDVDALLQGYLRLLRRRGGRMLPARRVAEIRRAGSTWRIRAAEEEFAAPVVVNAAGAWADPIAELAGLPALGIQPLRRTALTVDPPAGIEVSGWPNMIDVDEAFYFKPEAGHILISPADETPCEPCDAQPEEFDVAVGVDRFEQATGLNLRRVRSRWAGLRSFAPDRVFVAGFDPRSEGFFWLAGQGGYGIQSAPALAELTRCLIHGVHPRPAYAGILQHVDAVAPHRLL